LAEMVEELGHRVTSAGGAPLIVPAAPGQARRSRRNPSA
jgi:hypothetical protein